VILIGHKSYASTGGSQPRVATSPGSTVATVQETRHQFHEDLQQLERQALGGLEMVIDALECALDSIMRQDVGLGGTVLASADRIDRSCREVHGGLLSLLARQAPVAGDLRIVAALLLGDNAVDIAEQTAFVVTGLFREFTDASKPA
jgi:phosphate uptake regulator